MRGFQKIRFQALAAWKWLTSTFKTEWTIEDYPVNVRFHDVSGTSAASRYKTFPWTATVINWPGMFGAASTRLEALEDLRKKFEHSKASKEKLPRPGAKVPIQWAAETRIDRHKGLARHFTTCVLGLQWAWISDGSTLGDFHDEETNETLINKIRSTYGVDVSGIPNGNLVDIFDRIAEKANHGA